MITDRLMLVGEHKHRVESALEGLLVKVGCEARGRGWGGVTAQMETAAEEAKTARGAWEARVRALETCSTP